MKWTPMVWMVALACAGGTADDKDDTDAAETDVKETDAGEDTDIGDDTDTDDTDVATTSCELLPIPTPAQASGEPMSGESYTMRRVFQACSADDTLTASWTFLATNAAGEAICRFEVSASSGTTDDSCTTCSEAYSGVAWGAETLSDPTLCGLFAVDQDRVDYVKGLVSLGLTTTPDILVKDKGVWAPVLTAKQITTRDRTSFDDGVRVTLDWSFSSTW